ncbi:MAG: hypothetical protein HDT21_11870 [Ruminococcus sp.]|nr:hypothetical protein [Ruminococcus sp.]
MANERKPLTEEQVKTLYANYEKRASWTLEQIIKGVERVYFFDIFLLFAFLGIILGLRLRSAAAFIVCFLVGTAVGITVGKLKVYKIKNNLSEADKIERAEGYTQRFFDEVDKINDPTYSSDITTALVYVHCGNPDMALNKLRIIDSSVYAERPNGAHLYYSAQLSAYLLKGDLDHAADAYTKGFYYMNTYKNSPIYGAAVSLSLGMYEFYCGHYDISLQLLENAMRIHCATMKPENRIPDENMTSMICYWKAINLASIGNKAAAWDNINYCKNFYKTPYYRQCCEKLLTDMEENHKSEMISNEAIS